LWDIRFGGKFGKNLFWPCIFLNIPICYDGLNNLQRLEICLQGCSRGFAKAYHLAQEIKERQEGVKSMV
jgi:hypothetical protein